MFGGISFMVDERMAVAAGRDGDLLVRTDPARYDELLQRGGAPAYMGRDRPMGPGWLTVPGPQVQDEQELACWLVVGIESRSASKRARGEGGPSPPDGHALVAVGRPGVRHAPRRVRRPCTPRMRGVVRRQLADAGSSSSPASEPGIGVLPRSRMSTARARVAACRGQPSTSRATPSQPT